MPNIVKLKNGVVQIQDYPTTGKYLQIIGAEGIYSFDTDNNLTIATQKETVFMRLADLQINGVAQGDVRAAEIELAALFLKAGGSASSTVLIETDFYAPTADDDGKTLVWKYEGYGTNQIKFTTANAIPVGFVCYLLIDTGFPPIVTAETDTLFALNNAAQYGYVSLFGEKRLYKVTKFDTDKILVTLIENTVVPPPAPLYYRYVALLTQTGTDDPVATVLENTIGEIAWTYDAPADFSGTFSAPFAADKTVVFKGDTNPTLTADGLCNVYAYRLSSSVIKVLTKTVAGDESNDGNLKAFPIEIRIYL